MDLALLCGKNITRVQIRRLLLSIQRIAFQSAAFWEDLGLYVEDIISEFSLYCDDSVVDWKMDNVLQVGILPRGESEWVSIRITKYGG
jgi:hypothetical protein